MNFHELLNVAQSNKTEAQSEASIKRYSTAFTAPKKPPRSDVPSEAVLRFLAKKKNEEKQRAQQAQKKKEELLALRSQNTKNSKKAKIMASRTKDNDFSRIKLTEDEVEAKKKREAELLRMQLNDKVERMKARIEMEQKEMLLPRKRKRKSKHDDAADEDQNYDEDSKHINNLGEGASQKKISKKSRKELELEAMLAEIALEKKKKIYAKDVNKKNRPLPPPKSSYTNFNDLLQLASQKQFEPVKLPEVEVSDSDNRPLTKKQRALYYEEQARAQRKLATQNSVSSRPVNSKPHVVQSNVAKKIKSINNDRVVDQNNNSVKKNFHDQAVSDYKMVSKNVKPQYNGQMNPQASQSLQKEFSIPKKYLSQKHPSYISKNETSVPPSNPSSNPKAKKHVNSNAHTLNNVKSHSTGKVQNQMSKPGGCSRPDVQNSKIKSNLCAVSSYPEVQNHKTAAPKQQINGANKIKEQQSSGVLTNKPQKKLIPSNETPLRTEKGMNMKSSKNSNHSFNMESSTAKQPINRIHCEVDEEQTCDDLFMPGETLFRTENGNYVQSRKNVEHSGKKGNSSSFGPVKNVKKAAEQIRGINSVQMNSPKMIKSNQSVHNQHISNKPKQPVVNRTITSRETDGRPNPRNYVTSDKESPKILGNPGSKNKNNLVPSKNVPPKSSHPSQHAKFPDRTTPNGKVATVNRPLSAKPEMKRPGIPPVRPPITNTAKRNVSSKPFHINPYLDAPRRLLEPQRPPKPPMKRRIESDDDDDDDEDDDMSDFIDDGTCYDDTNYSEHIKEIFRYDRSKYYDEDDDDIMETSFAEQMKEEMRSAKLGYLEDLEDMRKEEEEKKRKMMKKKRLKP